MGPLQIKSEVTPNQNLLQWSTHDGYLPVHQPLQDLGSESQNCTTIFITLMENNKQNDCQDIQIYIYVT